MRLLNLLVIITLLTGCTVGPDYIRPDIKTPDSWQSSEKKEGLTASWPGTEWWKDFSDTELNSLIESALKNNYDIKAAVSRIEQSRAAAKVAGAPMFPSINAGMGITREQKASQAQNNKTTASQTETTSYAMQSAASYELDIWSKNRMAAASSDARIEGSIYDWQGIRLAMTAEVISTYFQILGLNDRLEIAGKTVESQKRIMDIIEKRYRAGMVSGLGLAQAKTNLSSVEASISAIQQQKEQFKNALAVLTGKNPGDIKINGNSIMLVSIPASIPAGLPSGLLERRPDIKKAEAELIAANADIGAAKAAMFPSITLTAQSGYTSQKLSSLINPTSAFYTIGTNLATVIFQGSRLSGEHERTKARYEELVYNYHKAVVSAFTDTENALVAVRELGEQEKFYADAVINAQKAYDISETQYSHGLVDYTTVLKTEEALLNSRNAQIQARGNKLTALTGLYKALGGGW
ncbi:MAG TPA: hypothetical protein DHV16_04760 [Nitrospiraceae bacterium]|nr:MAG: hypothetical protein A2Z82_11695 [Nitrospirae bacterium GWA2_46_11]HAK88315.1 hypothetical protein [Nitrospiraceae bacterium]HCZ11561.1 hypothetical protein [Nitrospiraceae bacterium]